LNDFDGDWWQKCWFCGVFFLLNFDFNKALQDFPYLVGGFKHEFYFPFHIWECHHPN